MTSRLLPREAARTTSLLKYLRTKGGWWLKVHGSPFQPRAIDVLGCLYGRAIGLEVKRPGLSATLFQQRTLDLLEQAGALVGVVWSNEDADKILETLQNKPPRRLDRSTPSAYVVSTKPLKRATSKKENPQAMTSARSTKRRAAPVVEEPEDELEDLEEIDDFEDDLDDEEEDDEEEEEVEETPRARNDRRQTASKAVTKPSKVTSTKPAAKAKAATNGRTGNASNLTPRRVAEGFVGAADIATEFKIEPRQLRVIFRKEGVEKGPNGLYEWKPNSKELKSIQAKVKKALAASTA